MDRPLRKLEAVATTLSTTIAARLRAAITGGDIAPGEKLRLEDLRGAFGVSLSPLREALSRLSAEGLVVMEDQRGYRVAPVSESNLLEVTRLRAEIEPYALREAIRRGDDDWEGELVATLYRLDKIEKSAPDARVDEWETAHRALHRKLIIACRMPLLMQFCDTLHDLSDRYRRLFLEDHPIDVRVTQEHADICNATLARDAGVACEMLRVHIERTGSQVLRAVMDKGVGITRSTRPAVRAGVATDGEAA